MIWNNKIRDQGADNETWSWKHGDIQRQDSNGAGSMVICRVMVRNGAEDVMIRKEKWARDGAEDKVIWGELWTVYGAEKKKCVEEPL